MALIHLERQNMLSNWQTNNTTTQVQDLCARVRVPVVATEYTDLSVILGKNFMAHDAGGGSDGN